MCACPIKENVLSLTLSFDVPLTLNRFNLVLSVFEDSDGTMNPKLIQLDNDIRSNNRQKSIESFV